MSSHSSHHSQEALLIQFSLYVHKGGLKPHSFHFPFMLSSSSELSPCTRPIALSLIYFRVYRHPNISFAIYSFREIKLYRSPVPPPLRQKTRYLDHTLFFYVGPASSIKPTLGQHLVFAGLLGTRYFRRQSILSVYSHYIIIAFTASHGKKDVSMPW